MVTPIEILLVEDNPGDARLAREGLRDCKLQNNLHIVADGSEALDYLHCRGEYSAAVRPDLILLDLNIPKVSGHEVLAEIKSTDGLKLIPVVVLTTSSAEEDVLASYSMHANCFISKPLDIDQFIKVVQSIEDFWFSIVRLPSKRDE